MKKIYLFAAMAAMLASCSSDDLSVATQQAPQTEVGDGAIQFSAYVNRGTTRAGMVGELTTGTESGPQISLQTQGFGVFAYYTDNILYGATATPNFMYNQKVSSSAWTYSPLKYWPNEFGDDAQSLGQDRLTFFAYAPYVDVIPETGRVDTRDGKNGTHKSLTSGIVGLTSNTTTGDPYVKYYVDMDPDNRVDLCWGVAKTALSSSVDGDNNTVAAGDPYLDVIKPKIADKINFDFKHALAALNVQIDADIDVESHATSSLNDRTKIWVRSVTFEGFTDKGVLNLNASDSEGPLWYELTSSNTRIGSGSVTVYDGFRDGREGQANAKASNETSLGLNSNLIQSEKYVSASLPTLVTEHTLTGVTNDPVNLFDATNGADDDANLVLPVYVIPTTDNLKVTIIYDVETYDPNVATYLSDGVTKGVSTENKIMKEITIGGNPFNMEAGKVYTVKLHLGMTSVKFDASVTEWGDGGTADTDLPLNARSIYVTPTNNNIVATGGQTVTLTGQKMDKSSLTLNEPAVTILSASSIQNGVSTADESSSVSFSADNTLLITPANTSIYKKVYAVQFNYNDGSKDYPSNTIAVTQAAADLTYTSPALSSVSAGGTFDIESALTLSAHPCTYGTTVENWKLAAITMTVNGNPWTPVAGTPSAEEFQVAEDGTVKIGTALSAGNKVKITVQAGDAAMLDIPEITVGS